jgi:hypothetical protein
MMLFEIYMTRSYVVSEEVRATVEGAIAEDAIEAVQNDMDALPWETTDEEPNQGLEIACERVEERPADFRAVGGELVTREC